MVADRVAPSLAATSLVQFVVGPGRLTLPDTSVDFVWAEGRVDVIGPMTKARPSPRAIGTRVVLLTAGPVTASRWLGTPLDLLTDRAVDLRDIDAGLAASLAERFAEGSVRDLVIGGRDPRRGAATRAGTAALHLSRGARIGEVAAAVNFEERQFARWFHHLFGMNPKRFQRVARLRRAMVAAKRGTPLAAAAADAGFADQAHLSREARALTGGALRSILPDVGNVQDFGAPLD